MRIGVLEAGGTKMVCAVGDENGQILERVSIATGKPEETIFSPIFFRRYWHRNIWAGRSGSDIPYLWIYYVYTKDSMEKF